MGSQVSSIQSADTSDLCRGTGYHKVENVSATGTYRGAAAAAGWATLLVSSLYTNTSRVSTVNAVYTIACPTEHLLYQCSYLRAEPATTTRECDRQTDTQTHLSWLVPVEKSTERVRGNEPVTQTRSSFVESSSQEPWYYHYCFPLVPNSWSSSNTWERETWDQRVNRCDDIYLHMVALI